MTGAATERAAPIDAAVDALDWPAISTRLNEYGNTVLSGMSTPQECDAVMGLYPNLDATSPAGSSCWRSNGRGCSLVRRSSHCAR
jgi:hypothetical protein